MQMPEMIIVDSTDEEMQDRYQPMKLAEIYKNYITSTKYPKEYLAAAVCKIQHREKISQWESKSQNSNKC